LDAIYFIKLILINLWVIEIVKTKT